jgi:hypothetical protein
VLHGATTRSRSPRMTFSRFARNCINDTTAAVDWEACHSAKADRST